MEIQVQKQRLSYSERSQNVTYYTTYTFLICETGRAVCEYVEMNTMIPMSGQSAFDLLPD